jgi:hypothetical protein
MKNLLITTGFIILFSYCAISQEQNDTVSTENKIDYSFYHSPGDSIIVEDPLFINEQDKQIDFKRNEVLNRNLTMLGFNVGLISGITFSIWARVDDNFYIIPKLLIGNSDFANIRDVIFVPAFLVGKKIIMSDNYVFYTSLGMTYIPTNKHYDDYFLPEIDLSLGRKVYESVYVNLGFIIIPGIYLQLSLCVNF